MFILGHEFKDFTRTDWLAFAGAEPGSLICHPRNGVTLIFDPSTGVISEIRTDNGGHMDQRDWTSLDVLADPEFEPGI